MKLIYIIPVILFLFVKTSTAQFKIPQVIKDAANLAKPGNPSPTEIGSAIKEALEIGISAGTDRLSIANGFLGNDAVKLLFPPEAKKVEKTLRSLGMNKACDDFILSLNRAAELAAKEAKPIFISALKEMSIQDAKNILLSKQKNAATSYFQRVTGSALRSKFQPIIQSSLAKTEATRYWTDLSTKYNQVPLASKVNTDLSDYATQKAMEGLFHEIEQEELKIRQNSGMRSSPLLKKVFGYADSGSSPE
jgi:hypothetical protein